MIVIIAGSRKIKDMRILKAAIEASGFDITEVIEGEGEGIDQLAKAWASVSGIPWKGEEARWTDLTAPGAIIRTDRNGRKYNAKAGPDRNGRMIEKYHPEALLAVRLNGASVGTDDMIRQAKAAGLKVFVYDVEAS